MKRFVLVLLLMCAAVPARATPPSYAGAQFRYWAFTGHDDLRDVIAYWVPGPLHVQLEYWDFAGSNQRDQFRPEVGLHLRDRRRSVYTVQWRHELDDERFTLGTDQVLSAHLVGRAEASPIVFRDSTQWVLSAGGDWYWGSWNFASLTVTHDPRGHDLWVVPMRVRLASESDDWLQATLSPASRRTIGWAFDVKLKGVRLGVERNSRYDFTNLDNVIYTIGYERSVPRLIP